MRNRILVLAVVLAAGALSWRVALGWQNSGYVATSKLQKSTYPGATVLSQAVGHEYRQDDWPAIVRMGGNFMGDEFALKKAEPIRVKARGTRPIARIELLKDSKVIFSAEPRQTDVSFQFNDTGDISQRHYYYVRLQQDDRMTAWSSPFFVNYQ